MIDGYRYGWAKGQHDVWCIHRIGAKATMLCGRRISRIPEVQPAAPSNVHRECLEAMYALGEQPVAPEDPGFGVCPGCGGGAGVVDGLVVRHGGWKVGADGKAYVSAARCPGEGKPPVEER